VANQPLLRIFIRLDKTLERDGQTDLPCLLQRSALQNYTWEFHQI